MTEDEQIAAKHEDYRRALAVQNARQRITEFRDRMGWDKEPEIPGPAPFVLLVEILMDMDRTAVLVRSGMTARTVEAAESISQWLLRDQMAEAQLYDPTVMRATENFAAMGFDMPAGGLTVLQQLFDAGREVGANEEASARYQQPAPVDMRKEVLGQVHASAQRLGLDPHHMRAKAERSLDRAELTREPTMKQCGRCSGAVYAGEEHYCPHDQAKAQGFRSFGDRGR